MNPDRSYDDRIRKAVDDLMPRLQGRVAGINRKPLHSMPVEAHSPDMSALEVARALLGKGQTLEALPLIEQAMPQYPQAASELKVEADAQIQAIREVMDRAMADDSSTAFELAKRAARSVLRLVSR